MACRNPQCAGKNPIKSGSAGARLVRARPEKMRAAVMRTPKDHVANLSGFSRPSHVLSEPPC
eukprot:2226062-Prymnesium_polylepis.1